MNAYESCCLCPRRCGADRSRGALGYCGESAELRIASASIHRGEEPPITGSGGSGAIFITGCTLGCVFCQNYQISGRRAAGRDSGSVLGRAVSPEEFARICLMLQEAGAENINLVTGSHAVPAIVQGIDAARSRGLRIPALWNSSAYESLEALSLLENTADIYLPDLKTLDSALGAKFFNAPDYPERAATAIEWMMKTRPGKVIIRHLVLPGYLESTREVIRWAAAHGQGRASFSLMTQYTPVKTAGEKASGPERFLSEDEYRTVLSWLEEFGIEDGYYQELVTSSDWLPDFSRHNPFSSELSVPVWHFSETWTGGI